jgi:hypothetical protein
MIRNPGAEINRSGDRCRKRISLGSPPEQV